MKKAGCRGIIATCVSALLLSACSDGSGENSDRANSFTDIASGADFSAPSDLAGLQGSATFNGAAVADFGEFGGTAEATINANFSDRTISGQLTNWEDRDPADFELDGSVVISNGSISNDGTFSAQVAGDIERTNRGPDIDPQNIVVFSGTAAGAFYDNVSGQRARVVEGVFDGTSTDGGDVSGSFVAER